MDLGTMMADSIDCTALTKHNEFKARRDDGSSKSTQCDFPRIFARYALERDFAIKVERIRDCAAQAVYVSLPFAFVIFCRNNLRFCCASWQVHAGSSLLVVKGPTSLQEPTPCGKEGTRPRFVLFGSGSVH